ncbi:MAG: hypothetical protein ACLURY_00690 [Alistipes putredinis]
MVYKLSSYRKRMSCEEVRKGYMPHGIDFRPFHAVRQFMMNFTPTPHCV